MQTTEIPEMMPTDESFCPPGNGGTGYFRLPLVEFLGKILLGEVFAFRTVLVLQRYDFYLSCARVWREKLCKAREKSINLFNCFSEPQPILCKSDDLTGVFNSCWVFGRAKCGIYIPKWGIYKPYWGMWEDGTNFVASL